AGGPRDRRSAGLAAASLNGPEARRFRGDEPSRSDPALGTAEGHDPSAMAIAVIDSPAIAAPANTATSVSSRPRSQRASTTAPSAIANANESGTIMPMPSPIGFGNQAVARRCWTSTRTAPTTSAVQNASTDHAGMLPPRAIASAVAFHDCAPQAGMSAVPSP